MKRILFVILFVLLSATPSVSKTVGNLEATSGAYIDFTAAEEMGVPTGTLAEITASPSVGAMFGITDGLTTEDSTVGGGTEHVLLIYDGSDWINKGGTITHDQVNLALLSVKLATSSTIVDVFDYFVADDSDGGEWTKRMQHTSWYNEPLNTATRGATRDFPAHVKIVAETDTVTLYDATVPAIPMWMVFNARSVAWQTNATFISQNIISAVSIFNGRMFVTGDTGTVGVSFLTEEQFNYRAIDATHIAQHKLSGSLLDRNDTSGQVSISGTPVVDNTSNDVAMTVLPEAPIDPITGIAVPTIAVATDGGVSVIDGPAGVGTVVDITDTTATGYASIKDDRLGVGYTNGASHIGDIPDIDYASLSAWRDYFINSTSIPATPTTDCNGLSLDKYITIAQDAGITFLKENPTTPAEGSVAYVTDTYNTGWMKGDSRLAALSDSVIGDLNDLVTNGGFDTDTGWTKGTGWTIGSGVASSDGTQAGNSVLSQALSINIGKWYTITFTITARSAGAITTVWLGGVNDPTDLTATGTYTYRFKTVSSGSLQIVADLDFIGSVDNVIVTEAIEDRSVKNNPLSVIGTISRTAVATDADQVAYSGFSANDYIEQPYTADLDTGTSAFHRRIALKMGANTAIETLFERDSATTAQRITAQVNANGTVSFTCDDDTTVRTATSTGTVDDSTWHIIDFVYSDGDLTITIDDNEDGTATGAALLTLSNASAVLRIGLDVQGANPLGNGSVCLLRGSATVPTASDLTSFYNDEKRFFEDNNSCLLPSANVQALSYDPTTDTHLIGTASGVTKFKGLSNVEDISDANLTSQDISSVSYLRDSYTIGSAAEVVAFTPEVNLREELARDPWSLIDSKLDSTTADFKLLSVLPEHREGRVFYDVGTHSLTVYSTIPDTAINVGQEMWMRVINKNGTTINNGEACRHDGVDATTALPKIVPALADTIEHSRVLGVATHDIAPNEEGWITTFGVVNDIDTSTYTVGVPFYLSDTVPGSYTTTPPDLVTQVGGVLVSDAVNGSAMVSIINHISLPTLFGILKEPLDTYTMSGDATYETVDNFNIDNHIGITVNKTTGVFTLPNEGWYRGTLNANVTIAASPPITGTDTINLRLYNTDTSTVMTNTTITVTASPGLSNSRSFSEPFEITTAGDNVELQVNCADNVNVLTFDSLSVDIESVNIR